MVAPIFGTTPGSKYGYKIGDVLVTDFITPNWYPPEHAGKTIDFKNHASAAFAVLPGGYAQRFDAHRRWVQVTGHMATNTQRSRAAQGTRRKRRTRLGEGLRRSGNLDPGLRRPSMGFAPKIKFAPDSPLEGSGFELPVPLATE